MDIPEDVVTLILVRLPVKSLLRFRCVCKAWCGLIGSRRFIDLHLRHPSQGKGNEYLVLKRFELEDGENENSMLSFYCDLLQAAAPDWRGSPPRMVSIGGPIDGLCLVGTRERPSGWGPWAWNSSIPGHPLYLCNPATREFRKIPDRPFGTQRARPSVNMRIPYNWSRVSVGFGYDHRTNEYKVVSIMHFLEDLYYSQTPPHGLLKIEIYHLSSNSWRVADTVFPTIHVHPDPGMDHPPYPRDLNTDHYQEGMFEEFTCGVFFNGSIHWTTSGYVKAILAFNVSDEVMRAFHLPRAVSIFVSRPRFLFVLDNCLAFVQRVMCEDYVPTTSFYVWVMVEYGDGESWIKRFYFQPGIHMDVLTFWNDMLICETEDGELASCNLQEDAPHQFRKHRHITKYVPESSNQQRVQQGPQIDQGGLRINLMAAMVMHKESLVHLR